MFKKVTLALAMLLAALEMQAQKPTGGVKGTVVSRTDRAPIQNAAITLVQGTVTVAETVTDEQGAFLIPHLENGMYDLVVNAAEYLETRVNVTVNDGYVKNLFTISLTLVKSEVTDEFFEEFDMDDTGYADTPTILFGQNDVFNNIAGYNFSAVRFRARGYASETQDVYVAGVRLNDAVTGYSPYSLWSGLNEATRTKSSVSGSEISDYGVGGYNGLTNLPLNASNVRTGWRGSVLTNSALYRLRLMLAAECLERPHGLAGKRADQQRLIPPPPDAHLRIGTLGQRLVLCLQRIGPNGWKRLGAGRVLPLVRLLWCRGEILQRYAQTGICVHGGSRRARKGECFHARGV